MVTYKEVCYESLMRMQRGSLVNTPDSIWSPPSCNEYRKNKGLDLLAFLNSHCRERPAGVLDAEGPKDTQPP